MRPLKPVQAPAARPCSSCPYVLATPSGIWAAEEYDKLPPYDADMPWQPDGLFMCHRRDGRLCAGWVGCHGAGNLLSVRIAVSRAEIAGDAVAATLDYATAVPLHPTGAAAAAYGKTGIDNPGPAARALVAKLLRMGLNT